MPAAKSKPKTRGKAKGYTLTKPIDAVFDADPDPDIDRVVTFSAEDVGLTFYDDDHAVARAVAMFPEAFA